MWSRARVSEYKHDLRYWKLFNAKKQSLNALNPWRNYSWKVVLRLFFVFVWFTFQWTEEGIVKSWHSASNAVVLQINTDNTRFQFIDTRLFFRHVCSLGCKSLRTAMKKHKLWLCDMESWSLLRNFHPSTARLSFTPLASLSRILTFWPTLLSLFKYCIMLSAT